MTEQQLQKGTELLEKIRKVEEHLRLVNKEIQQGITTSELHIHLKGMHATLRQDFIGLTKWSFMRQRWLNEYKAEIEKVVADLQKEFDSL